MRPLASRLLAPLLIVAVSGLSGCAPLHRTVEYTATGAADPRGDAKVKEDFEAERANPLPPEAESATILIDTVPEGVSLENGVLGIEDGYRHQIIGKFKMGPDMGIFPAYTEGWRKGVCYWQQPLVLVTLFIWVLVPTYYPCYVTGAVDKADMVDALKRVAYEAGGDLVIATYVGENQDRATSAVGFILRADPRLAGEGNLIGNELEDDEAEGDDEDDATDEAAPEGGLGLSGTKKG